MRFTLTDKYELEEEIDRLQRQLHRRNDEIETLTAKASLMSWKTFRLLTYLGMSEKEIFAYYREDLCQH